MKRKSVTYLNELKNDVCSALEAIYETGSDIDVAAYNLSQISTHDLVTDVEGTKFLYDSLNQNHLKMAKLLKEFRKARALYLEFF